MSFFDFVPAAANFEPKNALALGACARLAYEPQEAIEERVKGQWRFPTLHFFSHDEIQAFLAANGETIIVTFRGTEPDKMKDWLDDLKVFLMPGPLGPVHTGFLEALDSIGRGLFSALETTRTKAQSLWLTGHSLGGALAVLAVAKLLRSGHPVNGAYTFGQPRVGNSIFSENFDLRFKEKLFRFVNHHDIVTRMPPRALGYADSGSFRYFDKQGEYHDAIDPWNKFLTSAGGPPAANPLDRWTFLQSFFPEGLEDHNMDHYLKNLRSNFAPTPRYKRIFHGLMNVFKKKI